MKLQAPLTLETVWLNDWRYCRGLGGWQVTLLQVDVGWPPTVLVRLFGVGVRVTLTWGD